MFFHEFRQIYFHIYFRIPKKGSKQDDKGTTGSSLRKAADVVDDGKYKYSYGSQKPSRPHYGQQKSFEKPKKDEGLNVDIFGLMSGMKNTLKKEAKPQFEETEAGKKMAKQQPPPQQQQQQQQQQRGPQNQFTPPTSVPTTPNPGVGGGDDKDDPEIEALLADKVITQEKKTINALTGFFDENRGQHIFKCFICNKQLDGKPNLMTHLNGDRHKRTRRMNFTEVDAAKSRKVPMERPICRFFAATGVCKRYKSACPNRHER